MPISGGAAEKGPGGGGRTTFRPPWVKDGPQPIPMPVAPWTKKNTTPNESTTTTTKENGQPTTKEVKLQSREVKVPIMTERKKSITEPIKPVGGAAKDKDPKKIDVIKEDDVSNGNNRKEKSIPIKIEKSPSKLREPEKSTSNADLPDKSEKSGKFIRPQLKKVAKIEEVKIPKTDEPTKVITPVLKKVPPKEEVKPEKPQIPITRNELKSVANAPPPPPLPPGCGPPPPPPPPPGLIPPPPGFEKKPISEKQKAVLEKLKARPRRRPDWSDMMKEVESGRKLKHVQCNDRSNPILTSKSITNIKGQYIYETEKANVHNALLKQIQFGVSLKPTRTNDRSKPILAGLRKFRRQMTIEEQIQKSESRAQLNEVAPVEESEDEMDDIDKLRDDLQSTKQMLALELRNKEAEERENKRLLAKIQILEAELEREKSKDSSGNGSTTTSSTTTSSSAVDETLVKSLKKDAEEAQKTSKLLEKKYQEAAEQLDASKNELEEQKRQIANLEKKLSQAAQGGGGGVGHASRRQSEAQQKDSSPEPDLDLSDESESDEDEEKKEERIARRLNREVKMLRTKLVRLKDKEKAAKKERENLREAMKKNQKVLKEEHKKFKKLQKEVDKMAAMMKDGEGSDDDEEKEDDDEEEEEEAEEEETEEDDESETDESEEETESESESEPEDASDEDKKTNYEPRIKRHEGRLAALKKGNYLLQTNVDRLLDEINKMREKSVSLKADLDSVLSELG